MKEGALLKSVDIILAGEIWIDSRVANHMTSPWPLAVAIVAVAVNMLHADRAAVFVWDEEQTRVVPRVSHGFMPASLKVLRYEKGEGMVGKVLETGIPLIVPKLDPETLRPDIRVAIAAEGIHSLLNLPVKVNDQIIGVFNVGFTRPGAITEDTARLYVAMVQRAALSIENMQLFEKTKELAVIDGADHLFDGKTSEVAEAVEELLADFTGRADRG